MKKLLLSTLLIGGALSLNAQNLYIVYNGEPVANNSTIVFDGLEILEEKDGNTLLWTEYLLDPHLTIVSDVDAVVTVHAESNESIQLCAGSDCIQGTNITKDAVNLVKNVPLDLKLDVDLIVYPGEQVNMPDEYKVKITAWYNNNPNDVYTVNLNMLANAGVESVFTNNSVSFNNNSLNYDLTSDSQLSVYSLSGKNVYNANVSGTGSVNLGHLAKGVYLYRVAGKAAKIIIR